MSQAAKSMYNPISYITISVIISFCGLIVASYSYNQCVQFNYYEVDHVSHNELPLA